MVKVLFVATCLLSIVSWYTTEQGMALYLSVWFAVLASLGVQGALVCVAWLIGFTKSRRTLLGLVYAITATVSIAFSYVSLYTWFSARERPAAVLLPIPISPAPRTRAASARALPASMACTASSRVIAGSFAKFRVGWPTPMSTTTGSIPNWRQSTVMAAPPAWKLATI